jgi:hypothetical protein
MDLKIYASLIFIYCLEIKRGFWGGSRSPTSWGGGTPTNPKGTSGGGYGWGGAFPVRKIFFQKLQQNDGLFKVHFT